MCHNDRATECVQVGVMKLIMSPADFIWAIDVDISADRDRCMNVSFPRKSNNFEEQRVYASNPSAILLLTWHLQEELSLQLVSLKPVHRKHGQQISSSEHTDHLRNKGQYVLLTFLCLTIPTAESMLPKILRFYRCSHRRP